VGRSEIRRALGNVFTMWRLICSILRRMRTSPNSQFSQTSSIGHGVGRSLSSTAVSQKQRVVILGSGWGGYGLLRGIDKGRYGACVCVCSVIQKPTMIA